MGRDAFRLTGEAWDSPLDERLRFEPESVRDLFPAGSRPSADALKQACDAAARLPVDRKRLSAALRAFHAARQAPPGTLAAIEAIAREGTFLVVAGQQPGILGGPLYTLHKAAGAVALARAWNALGIGTFVPAFWIASDDHDLAEMNTAFSPGAEGGPRKWAYPIPDEGRPAHAVRLPAGSLDVARRFFGTEGEAPAWSGPFLPVPGETLADGFARILLSLFDGLVVIEPAAMLWPAAGDPFARLLTGWEEIRPGVEKVAADLAARGFGEPVPLPPGTPLFFSGEGRRRRVDGKGDWAARIARDPAAFSPDVLGRVACQNALLPVAAQVTGPHETAYWPLAAPLTRHLGGVSCPVIPRPGATWLDAASREFLARTGIQAGRMITGDVSYEEAIAARVPPETRMHLESFDEALDGALLRLADLGLSEDPNLAEPLRKGRARIEEEAARLKRRITGAAVAGQGLGLSRWEEVTGWIRPRGRLQERVYACAALLARVGRERALDTLSGLDPFDFRHQVLSVS